MIHKKWSAGNRAAARGLGVLGLVFVLGLGIGFVPGTAVYAQSNMSLSTAGRFTTDVDDFIGVSTWSGVLGGEEPKSFFAYTRLGQGTLNGNLELGAAVNVGALYVGALYNGWFQADAATTTSQDKSITKPNGDVAETRTFYRETRNGRPLTIEALVGLGSMGIKVGYTEQLKVTPATFGENTYKGFIKPYVGIGFASGLFKEAVLSLNFNRDEKITLDANGNAFTSTGSSAQSQVSSESDINKVLHLKDGEGSYIEPELYIDLDLGMGGLELENTLGLRFYTNSAPGKSDGKTHDPDVNGLAWWNTTYSTASGASSITAVWDEKFSINDVITPSYGLGGAALNDTIGWKVRALLPVTIGLDTDKFSSKTENGSGTTKKEGFGNNATFNFGLAPAVETGVSWKPFSIIDVHAGVEISVFDWELAASSSAEVKKNDSTGVAAKPASANSESTFTGPVMTFGLGTTVSIGPLGIDLILLKGARPTIDGTIYEAVSGGLNAAFVISAKF